MPCTTSAAAAGTARAASNTVASDACTMGADIGFEITVELHDVTASDDHVVALVSAHAVRDDTTLDYDTAEIFHVKDGKVTERWAFSDDTARITEFFG